MHKESLKIVNKIKITQEIVQLSHEIRFAEVTTKYVRELLDVHDKPLSNQELEELVEILDNHQLESAEYDEPKE